MERDPELSNDCTSDMPSVDVDNYQDNGVDLLPKQPSETKPEDKNALLYRVTDTPPLPIIISVGLQNILIIFAGQIAVSNIIADTICAPRDHPIRAKICCMALLMNGVCTIGNTLLGVRLPVLQGMSSAFLFPLFAIKLDPRWQCKELSSTNGTNVTLNETIAIDQEEEMYVRIREIMGSLMAASSLEVIVGATGLVGLFSRFIGPLTVSTVVFLIGISLYPMCIHYCRSNWGLSIGCIVLISVCALKLDKVMVLLPTLPRCLKTPRTSQRKQPHQLTRAIPIFRLFAVLIGMLVIWLLCYILTLTEVLPSNPSTLGYMARTDAKSGIISASPWFYFPYPGQFGSPLINPTLLIGYMFSAMISVFESLGDYHFLAKQCKAPVPPRHALNRGIMMEGLGALLSASLGTGIATTSYTSNMIMIGVTKDASRAGMIAAGIFCIILSIFGKVGAVFATMPDPTLGGTAFFTFSLLSAFAVFNLQNIDMKSHRNSTIFGISVYAAFVVPGWLERDRTAIKTGNSKVDGILTALLSTPLLIGGFLAVVLDNLIKGTKEERGLHSATSKVDDTIQNDNSLYDPPGARWLIKKVPCMKHVPVIHS